MFFVQNRYLFKITTLGNFFTVSLSKRISKEFVRECIYRIGLAIAVTSVMVAVALAPIMLSQALAARTTTTTCTNGGGHTKDCGTPPANCETTTTKAGEGKGGGEIKGSTSTC